MGRTKPTARRSLSQPTADSSLYAREPAPLPSRLRRATFPQGKVRERSRRRQPSPTGKVDRAQPGPDEGCRAKITKQATLNGKRFRSTWPVFDFWVVFPHPSRLTACHLPRRGRRPPGGGAFIGGAGLNFQGPPPHPARLRRSTLSKQERAASRRGKAQRAFSGPCVFWHCMVQCPKNRQAPGGKGGFFCPVSRPSRPLWSPL